MSNVVGFPGRKNSTGAHITGPCVCVGCGHQWQGVAPVGTIDLECPACGALKGIWTLLIRLDEEHFYCPCGNHFLHIIRSGAYCPNCGRAWPWDELA